MGRRTYAKKIKNGKEYYFFRFFNPPNKPKDLYAADVKTLEKKIRDAKVEASGGKSSSSETFDSFFKSWLYDTNLVNKKPSTRELYDSVYRIHIQNSPIAPIKMKSLKVDAIQSWYNSLYRDGTSTNIIKKINKLVAPSIRFAASVGKLSIDFSKLITIPQDQNEMKKNDIRPLTQSEQQIFEKALDGEYLEALYRTALYTGMRQGELLALRWRDVNLAKRIIKVSRSYKISKDIDSGIYIGAEGPPKTKASIRDVPIPLALADYLRGYRKQEILRMHSIGGKFDRGLLVFHDGIYDYLNSGNVRKNLKKILSGCGIADRRFHDLRHTYATRLFELGESAKAVQTILGHSDVTITLNTYTHVSGCVTSASADKLDQIYGGK